MYKTLDHLVQNCYFYTAPSGNHVLLGEITTQHLTCIWQLLEIAGWSAEFSTERILSSDRVDITLISHVTND